MIPTPIYDIHHLRWDADSNSFTANMHNLYCVLPDHTIHPEYFPNFRKKFIIRNNTTQGFRVFKHYRDFTYIVVVNECDHKLIILHFISEDMINCFIYI